MSTMSTMSNCPPCPPISSNPCNQVNIDTGETIQKKLPNGLFPTEPLFVARPGAEEEDDGVVVMSGIDGGKEKGYVIVYDATNMEVLYHATSPRKTLFGVHSKFYSFTDGCWQNGQHGGDCTPTPAPPTTTTTANPTTTTANPTTTTTTVDQTTTTTAADPTKPDDSASSHTTSSLLVLIVSLMGAMNRF